MIFDLSSQVWYFFKGKDLIITTENWKFAYLSVFLSNLVTSQQIFSVWTKLKVNKSFIVYPHK